MIDVLIVEDDRFSAEALAEYIGRLAGFTVVGHARTGVAGLQRLAVEHVDLVMLDIYLPDMSGLDVLRRLRGGGNTVDVVAVTRARDLAVVQAAVAFGVAHYLVKPFTFANVRARLERYQAYRTQRTSQGLLLAQRDVDELLGRLRETGESVLPKGISRESLHAVVAAVKSRAALGGVSAAELAHILGVSRVTARRYLEYLVETGLAHRRARYHGTGRPEFEYTWPLDSGHETGHETRPPARH